jgi:hypothetical protein
MRRCAQSEEVREALAGEQPMAPDLAAHVAACAACSRVSAAARRFDAHLDAAVASLVTDALPPTTAVAARMAPRASRRRTTSGTLASTLLAGAFVVFAVVGVVTTGVSISDAMRSGSASEPEWAEADLDQVDCYVGGSIVEVTVERVGDTGPEGLVAYCFGVEPPVSDRQAAAECARSAAAAAAAAAGARRAQEGPSAGDSPIVIDPQADDREACLLVEERDAVDRRAEVDAPPSTSRQFDSWEEAAGSTGWPMLRPGWLPDGYDLAALQGFSGEHRREAVESVSATYLRNGILLSFDQFEILDPDHRSVEVHLPGYDLGDVSAGQTTVGDHPAFWASGLVGTLGGSEAAVLELVWNDGTVGYRISARNEDLETLEHLAESLTDR